MSIVGPIGGLNVSTAPAARSVGQATASPLADVAAFADVLRGAEHKPASNLLSGASQLCKNAQPANYFASAYKVRDAELPLNSAGLPYSVFGGDLELNVLRSGTPDEQPVRIPIRSDTSLQDIAAALNQVEGLSAEVNFKGRLEIKADSPDVQFSMDDRGSGALKALGRDNPELRAAFDNFVGQTFFGQMLSSMRKTVGKAAYFDGGQAEKIFTSQLDQVLAEKLAHASQGGGDGWVDVMYEQMFLHP